MDRHDLAIWRHKRQITQHDLARLVGRSLRTIVGWERGETPIPAWLERALRDIERENANDRQ